MLPVALRASLLAHLLLLGGCAAHLVPIVKVVVAPDGLEGARTWATMIVHGLPAYQADPLSKFEQPEILNVERDIESVQEATDDALFIEEVELLKKDWGTLVALDNTLQQESVI